MRKHTNFFALVLVSAISMVILTCNKEIPNVPPDCLIVTPDKGQIYEVGDTVTIRVEADDEDGKISGLEIKIDGASFRKFSEGPFQFAWPTKIINEGQHTITAIATDDNGDTSKDETVFFLENRGTLPTASFDVSDTIIAVGEIVSFVDQSGNEPNGWLWDFGDGAASEERNPSHSYSAQGKYTVTLTASNLYGEDQEAKENLIDVGLIPEADFVIVDSMPGVGIKIQFLDLSTNNPLYHLWNFGDGTTSTDRNPLKVYQSAGTYDIKLTVGNQYGEDEMLKPGVLTIRTAPVAKFSASKTEITVGTRIIFTDESENDPYWWNWDFGDGTGTSLQNPGHTYTKAGSFDVSLRVGSLLGSDSLTKPGYILVHPE